MADIEKQIKELRVLAEDNHKILKKLHKALVFERVKTIVYWVLIVGIAIGAFVFLQPYVDSALDVIQSVREGVEQGREVHESFTNGDVQGAFEN